MKIKKKVSMVSRGVFNTFTYVKDVVIRKKRANDKRIEKQLKKAFMAPNLPTVDVGPTWFRTQNGHFRDSHSSNSAGGSSNGSIMKQLEEKWSWQPTPKKAAVNGVHDATDHQDDSVRVQESSEISLQSLEPDEPDIEVKMIPLTDDYDKLMILDTTASIAITEGTMSLTLLYGAMSVNGYKLEPSKQVKLSVGLTCNHAVLNCCTKFDQDKLDQLQSIISSILSSDNGKESDAVKSKAALVMESIRSQSNYPNVTIVRVKRIENMATSWLESVILKPSDIFNIDKNYFKLSSTAPAVERCNQWHQLIHGHNLINLDPNSTVLVIGPSNSGKTSFLKQLINNLASKENPFNSVLFIDLDCGQSELSLPGSVSFTEINLDTDKYIPLISSPFINAINYKYRTIKSVSVGTIDTSTDPDQYINSVVQLLKHVNEYLNNQPDVPILINTMGWIRGIGQLLNIDVIRLTKPSFVIELKEIKTANPVGDRNLDQSMNDGDKNQSAPIPDFDHNYVQKFTTAGWTTDSMIKVPSFKYIQWPLSANLKRDKHKAKNRLLQQLSYFVSKEPLIMFKPVQQLKRIKVDMDKVYFKVNSLSDNLPTRLIPSVINWSWVQLLVIDETELDSGDADGTDAADASITDATMADANKRKVMKLIENLPQNEVIGTGILIVYQCPDGNAIESIELITPEDESVVSNVNCIANVHGLFFPPELHSQSLQYV